MRSSTKLKPKYKKFHIKLLLIFNLFEKQEEESNEKTRDCLNYFEPEYRKAMFGNHNHLDSLCKKTFLFSKKLDQSLKKSDNLHSECLLDPESSYHLNGS